jgi:hypothetical protein
MSLKRKLVVVGGALVLAGGATGAGLAAGGHRSIPSAPRHVRLAGTTERAFLDATAEYLGTDVATLRHETKRGGRTLAEIADATPGRSAKQLAAVLVSAGTAKLEEGSDRALTRGEQSMLHTTVQRRITSFLNDTCPLSFSGLVKHLAGCAGMFG